MAAITASKKTLNRGGWAALGQKVGVAEAAEPIDISALDAGETVDVYEVEEAQLVLATVVEVLVAADTGATLTLESGGAIPVDVAGVFTDNTAQVLEAGTARATLLVADGVAGSSIRISTVVADIGDLSGD